MDELDSNATTTLPDPSVDAEFLDRLQIRRIYISPATYHPDETWVLAQRSPPEIEE